MTSEPRTKRARQFDKDPCGSLHNFGRWPYIAACVLNPKHKGDHMDKDGNTWNRTS